MAAPRLRSFEFRRERAEGWRQLARLVTQVEDQGIDSLSGSELAQLPQLYRGTLSSLSVARAISLDRNLLDYLESLCQRAYLCVYGSRRHALGVIKDFFVTELPSCARQFRWHIFTAFLFLLIGVIAGFAVTMADPDKFHAFVPAGLAAGRGPEASEHEMRESLYGDPNMDNDELGELAGMLFSHNASLGILYFALGFAAGLPVFFFMIHNGLMIGAFFAAFRMHGLELDLFAWLMIHGVTELLAIVICAGAGLALAHSLVFPGRFSRLENLARTGRRAASLVVAGVLMLLLAGFIEGIARQRVTDMGARLTVAAVSAALWFTYFVFCGRRWRR